MTPIIAKKNKNGGSMGLFSGLKETAENIGTKVVQYNNPLWYGQKFLGDDMAMVPFVGSGYTANKNFASQMEQQAYQRNLQQQMFNREDTSIARRTQDLINSGLSPVLAAGQGASAGAAISSQAPQRDDTSGASMQVLSLLSGFKGLETQDAQKENIEANTRLANASSATKWWDFQKFVESGMASNASGLSKTVRDAIDLIQQGMKSGMFGGAKKFVEDKVTSANDYIDTILGSKQTAEDKQNKQQQFYLDLLMDVNKQDPAEGKRLLQKLIKEGKLPK